MPFIYIKPCSPHREEHDSKSRQLWTINSMDKSWLMMQDVKTIPDILFKDLNRDINNQLVEHALAYKPRL